MLGRRRPTRSAFAALAIVGLVATACGGGGVEDDGETAAQEDDAGDEAGDAAEGEAEDAAGDEAGDDGGAETADEDVLRIGMTTSLSGSLAIFGEANRNGAQLAVDQLNADGGVLGRELELIVTDDDAAPETGVQQVRDLVIDDGVDALLGPVSSGVALAVNEVAREREIPIIYHTSNTEALPNEEFHEYMAMVVPNTGMEARAQAVDLAEGEWDSWATIAPNYEFGQRQTATFVETMEELASDKEIVEQQFPELGESDYQPYLSSIISAGPDAVYSPLFAGDLVTFTQQADNLGFFDQVYFTALYETDALQELGGDFDLDGVRGYSRCPFTIETPQMAEFVEEYEAEFGEVPSDWACMAYDSVLLWAQVVEEAGDASGDAFAGTVGGFEFTSLRGDTHIRDVDHQADVASYIGELEFDDERGFYVYGELDEVPGSDIWLDEDEVEATRE